jgi:hypothetical protein
VAAKQLAGFGDRFGAGIVERRSLHRFTAIGNDIGTAASLSMFFGCRDGSACLEWNFVFRQTK